MFVVYVLASVVVVCTALPHDTILLDRDNNYALPLNYDGLPSYEGLLELYQKQLRNDQEARIRQQSHHIDGHHELGPLRQLVNLHEPSHHLQDERRREHHDVYDHSHGHKTLASDHDTLIEFNRLKLLAKEAEHYFRPEFNGHKLRHHELIAYIEQLLKFGAEKDKRKYHQDGQRNAHLEVHEELRNSRREHETQGHKPILVPEELLQQKPLEVPSIEHLLRPYEEHRSPFEPREERDGLYHKTERRPQHIRIDGPQHKIHEVVEAHIKPNGAFFVPNSERSVVQRERRPEHNPCEVCINCGDHHQRCNIKKFKLN